MDIEIKNQIITAVQSFFLSPLMDQLTGFGQVTAIQILQHLFNFYKEIDKIDPEENAVKMMGPYEPTETLSRLTKQIEKK